MDNSNQGLYTQLEACGLKGRVVSIHHLTELEEDISGRNSQGQFDDAFYQERLTFFTFTPPDDFPKARSLIVVAGPRPQTQVKFTRHGKTLTLILPPTYLGHSRVFDQTGELLGELLAPD